MRLLRLRMLVRFALRRDHRLPLPSIPAHGRVDGREALEERRKRRLMTTTMGMTMSERDMKARRATGAACSKTAISVLLPESQI
jgi:hypothetical protein